MKAIDVVFISDKNYLQHFTVACTSLLENSNSSIGRIFLIHDIEYDSDLEKMINYFYEKYERRIETIYFDSSILDNYSVRYHLTKSTYVRLYLVDILPKNIKRVLYLDVDLIVLKDLSELAIYDFYSKDMDKGDKEREEVQPFNNEFYIYAVDHELNISGLEQFKKIEYDHLSCDQYFNAGVLLINLKKWREDNIINHLVKLLEKYDNSLKWMDQDLLNIAFNSNWGKLDYSFNVFKKERSLDDLYKIIHYIGPSKPWHYRNNHPLKYLYWQYLRITPYKNYFPPDLTTANVARKYLPLSVKRLFKRLFRIKSP